MIDVKMFNWQQGMHKIIRGIINILSDKCEFILLGIYNICNAFYHINI